jgi:hypothetical protein
MGDDVLDIARQHIPRFFEDAGFLFFACLLLCGYAILSNDGACLRCTRVKCRPIQEPSGELRGGGSLPGEPQKRAVEKGRCGDTPGVPGIGIGLCVFWTS